MTVKTTKTIAKKRAVVRKPAPAKTPKRVEKAEPKIELPPGVVMSDINPPKDWKDAVYDAGDCGRLTFYRTENLGWVLATLQIRKAGKRSRFGGERTYAAKVDDGGVCTVGLGPHILQTVIVYLTKKRLPAMQKYLDLHKAGAAQAGEVRDRISSRRAEGALRRSRGESSWRWSV